MNKLLLRLDHISLNRTRLTAKSLLGVAMAVSMVGVTHAAAIDVNTSAYGNTWGEWSARWVQWALSIPDATNPISDPDGDHCELGQSGSVWFLAGTNGGAVTRTCTVPAGKALFFPIVNGMFGAGVFDCDPTAPVTTPCIIPTLRKAAAESMDSVTLEASVDGVNLRDLHELRVASPEYTLTLPPDNFVGVPAGTYSPNVADGYYVLLKPLRSGAHTIHFKGDVTAGPFLGFSTEVTYNLTVSP